MTDFHMILRFIVFLIGSNCVVFHFYFSLSTQLVMKTKQVGIGNSIRIYVSHILSTKIGTQTCVNWVIRYLMQDVGLKYPHLSTDYETTIQSLIEACERHMAKETKGIKCKVHCKSKH